jgi:hypothetical protein
MNSLAQARISCIWSALNIAIAPKRDGFRRNRHRALAFCSGMIVSENRFPLFQIVP